MRITFLSVFTFKTNVWTSQKPPDNADVSSGNAATYGTSNSCSLRTVNILIVSLYYTKEDSAFMMQGSRMRVKWLSAGGRVNPNKKT